MWSLGVILYILLSGLPPFWGDTEEQIFKMVAKAEVDFASSPWPNVSPAAKVCSFYTALQAYVSCILRTQASALVTEWAEQADAFAALPDVSCSPGPLEHLAEFATQCPSIL